MVQSDVSCLLTCIDDDVTSCTMVQQDQKYLEYNPGSELNMNNEQWTMKSKELNENKIRTKDEQNRMNSNNNKINRTTIIKYYTI